MYNVFSDFHHASLLNSLIILFEERLGGNLYRPIGMEWAEQGYWKVYDHPATQAQFLGMEQGYRPQDGTRPLNNIEKAQDDVYYCQDIDSGFYNKAITLETFFKLPIDIVIASIPQHIEPFQRLALAHPNKPKFIFQIGNQWNLTGHAQLMPINVMASAKIPAHQRAGVHFIEYHQEFDTEIFSPTFFPMGDSDDVKTVTSFVNCFSLDRLFESDWRLFQEVERLMPDWKFECLGGQCRDGAAHGSLELAEAMKSSKFIWHTKTGGDGYGHVLHNSAAVGKPLIIRRMDYYDKMGDALIKDGKTAIVIDGLSPTEIVEKILYFSEPIRYRVMCQNVRSNFVTMVNFDEEFLRIKQFLSQLL